jgi:proteic killer suppression protein
LSIVKYTATVITCFTFELICYSLVNMEYEFNAQKLYLRLLTDARFTAGFPSHIVSKFRMRIQQIVAALNEKDFYNSKGLHYEKLHGDRSHQHSMKLNDQWRLILELEERNGQKVVRIIGIEDYH